MKTIQITKQMIEDSLLKDVVYVINEVLKNVEDDTCISLEKGHYDLRTTYAYQEVCYISNNDSGLKSLAFLLRDKKNIVIDGNGSFLNGIGRILPFYLTGCTNVTVKNFTIDYQRPFTSQGEVLESTPTSAVLKIDKKEFPYELRQGIMHFIGEDYRSDFVHGLLEYYKDVKRPIANVFDNGMNTGLHAEELEDGVVRIYHQFRMQPTPGNMLTIKHEQRYVPAITIDQCDTVKIENIWIKQAGTMGVVAQVSKDITIDHVDIYADPESQRVFSINADGTHFVNCSGTVIVENGRFESMFDDIINVHGNYLRVAHVVDNNNIIVEIPHRQQEGFFNFFVGNKLSICDQPTMMELGFSTVKSFEAINNKYYKMELEEAYAFEADKTYCIDNVDLYPVVIFRNNDCGRNRARGLILTSTKETIVENNIIDSEGSAVKVNSDMKNWYESGAISKLIIRNNKLTRKNHVNWGEALIDIDPGMKQQIEGTHYHGEMIIEGNEIVLAESPLFYGYCFEHVQIANNKIHLTNGLKADKENFYVQTKNCGQVDVLENEWLEEE